ARKRASGWNRNGKAQLASGYGRVKKAVSPTVGWWSSVVGRQSSVGGRRDSVGRAALRPAWTSPGSWAARLALFLSTDGRRLTTDDQRSELIRNLEPHLIAPGVQTAGAPWIERRPAGSEVVEELGLRLKDEVVGDEVVGPELEEDVAIERIDGHGSEGD